MNLNIMATTSTPQQLSSRLSWASGQQAHSPLLLRPCRLAALQQVSSSRPYYTLTGSQGISQTGFLGRLTLGNSPFPSAPRPSSHCVSSGRGFGASNRRPTDSYDSDDENGTGGRFRKLRPTSSVPNRSERDRQAGDSYSVSRLQEETAQPDEGEAAFKARLAAIIARGKERARAAQAAAGLEVTTVTIPNTTGVTPAAFDASLPGSAKDIYANPPSLSQTLGFGSDKDSSISDPKLRDAAIGPSQIGLAITAIVLVGIFLLVSGGDYQPSKRKSVRPANAPPTEAEARIIQNRIFEYEGRLAEKPGDPEALEALAVSYAQLFQFDKAAGLLDTLVAEDSKDADAWRLLGETRLLAEQPSKAVVAYERGLALRPNSAQMLTGIAEAYLANNQPAKAADLLLSRRDSVKAAAKAATDAAGGSSKDGEGGAAVDVAGISKPLDPITLELLLGKVYNSWRGHESDALAVYEGIVRDYPEDFRGYLAKGVYLKEKGRGSDAERMFLQARFYAPEGKQGIVKQISEYSPPLINLPS